jgi:hypothetical protein
LDALDLTARSLDGRYPPLEPTSSPGSFNSAQQSPEHGRVKIAPSLLSNDQSSTCGSPGVVEYGLAHSASIQAFNKPNEFDLKKPRDASIIESLGQVDQHPIGNTVRPGLADKHPLAAPFLTVQQRLVSLHHVGCYVNDHSSGSSQHSDPSSSENRPIFLRSNVICRFNREVSPKVTSGGETGLQTAKQEAAVSDIVPLMSVTGNTNAKQNDFRDEVSVSSNNKRDSKRSSKYGYHIRESFDAHEIIMGKGGDSQVGKTTQGQNQKQLRSSGLSRNGLTRELKIQLTTPSPKNKSNKRDVSGKSEEKNVLPSSDGNGNVMNKFSTKLHNEIGPKSKSRVSGIKSPVYSSHPPRTSSLQGTPPASSLKEVKVSHSAFASRISVAKVANPTVTGTKSATGGVSKTVTSQPSSPSMLYRHTAASAARASLNGKKAANFRTSTSRMSHSHTFSSFSDVGKGMKKLGKKMGKIIPGRRTAPVPIDVKEKEDTESGSNNSTAHLIPQRQASRLLTTYENSGMSKTTDDDLHLSAKTTDDFGNCEPTDKHESEQATQDKNTWHAASYGFVRTDGGMHFFGQSVGGAGIPFGGSDGDDDPPNFRQDYIGMQGHYNEVELMPSDEDLPDTQRGSPLSTPTRTEYDFSENNSAHTPSSGVNAEADDPQISASERGMDRTGAGNPVHEAFRGASNDQNLVSDTSGNADDAQNPTPNTPANASGFQNPVSVVDGERMLSEADAKIRELMTWAMGLEESRLRDLVVTVCARLAHCIIQVRTARISFIEIGLAADELICFIENSVSQVAASVSQHRQ